jgi:ubiquinone/menaquinone biosynthesis C-methylase UbiE
MMTTSISTSAQRKMAGSLAKQFAAWVVAGLFVAGFFWSPMGMWTGMIIGAWFVGTQRPLRGMAWLLGLTLVPMLIGNWKQVAAHGAGALVWMVIAALAMVLPLLVYRLTTPRLPGLAAMLPLPLASVAMQMAVSGWLPGWALGLCFGMMGHNPLLRQVGDAFGTATVTFLMYWFAATAVWVWTHELRAPYYVATLAGFGGLMKLLAWLGRVGGVNLRVAPGTLGWIAGGGVAVLAIIPAVRARKAQAGWVNKSETVAMLRSPVTGAALNVDSNGEALVSEAGERFAIQDGMPVFLRPEDLNGANLKYNHLYETIGGFYDDSQRVACAMAGFNRDAYVMSYLSKLEVRLGDRVLETSVGTGLNFKYLPRAIRRFGLDLSREMLVNCQANLQRWGMDGELFLGNAECLPFADESFDVVFHVGGINFFSDRGKAIREMVRVAKPGSLLLIADETEEHVKAAFENIPITNTYFKGRDEAVSAPVDLLPEGVEDVTLEILNVVGKNRFYALTFRKGTGPKAAIEGSELEVACASA